MIWEEKKTKTLEILGTRLFLGLCRTDPEETDELGASSVHVLLVCPTLISLHAAAAIIWFWTEGEQLILSCRWGDVEEWVVTHSFAGKQEVE